MASRARARTFNTLAAVAAATLITPSISAARTSARQYENIFFDASATVAASLTSLPFHELYYAWDYGDGSAGTWSMGARAGQSKNISYGPQGAHLYETAGSYTVTLYVYHYDSGGVLNVASTTQAITISTEDSAYLTTNTICVSTSGTFTGAPSGATQVTSSDFVSVFNTYKGTNKRILYRAGETFSSASGGISVLVSGMTIGRFGTGADPIFNALNGTTVFSLGSQDFTNLTGLVVRDIEVNGGGGTVVAVNGNGTFNQITLFGLNIHDIDKALFFSPSILDYWNNNGYPGHTMWDQLSFIDCRVNNIHGGTANSGDNVGYVGANRFSMMGCDLDANHGGEHGFRSPHMRNAVVSNNTIQNPAASIRLAFKLHAGTFGGSGVDGGSYTEKVVMSENIFSTGTVQSDWMIVIGPQNGTSDERHRDIIFERNYIIAGSVIQQCLLVNCGGIDITVRNNVVNMALAGIGCTAINVGVESTHATPIGTGRYVYNNTVYATGAYSRTAITTSSTMPYTIVKNNLAYTPSATSNTAVSGTAGTGSVYSNNSSNAQMLSTSPLFSSTPGTTVAALSSTAFKITTGSYGIDGGTYVPAFDDLANVTRTGTYDIGALQP